MLLDFSLNQALLIGLLFIWAGFVRTGLGFGGAALGLPLMLFIHNDPRLWLPIISTHLLFFSGLTLRTRLHNVDWRYLRQSSIYIIPPAILGVFGLVNLPILWLNLFIYGVTLFYGLVWLFNKAIESRQDLHFLQALMLLPIAAIGHVMGLKAHQAITRNELLFKRWVGGGLVVVSALGLWNLLA